jgi:hypothetical protein
MSAGMPIVGPRTTVKTCGGCRKRYTLAGWQRLRLCCVKVIDVDDGQPVDVLEMRHCVCGSTIAVQLDPVTLARRLPV